MAKEKTRRCAQCGDPMIGRSDKKFCSSQCRFLYHHSKRSKAEAPILRINAILRKNRTILKSLCPKGKATVRREVMETLQYDFSVFSSSFKTKRGIYYLCYDYAFTPTLEKGIEKALIVTRQPYMKVNDPWGHLHSTATEDDDQYFL